MASWQILVADDDPLVVATLRDILASLPATVLEARDGEEALRSAKAERPDLILLDVMMPRLDGFQVAATLKQDPSTAGIPIVFVSALGASQHKVRGLELGAEDYLTKPIDPEELKARVRMILRRSPPAPREAPLASGHLGAMNLMSLVQLFEVERRTTRLVLTRPGEAGEIVVMDGRIIQARQGARRGKAAVYKLLTWKEGTFEMAPAEAASQVGETINLSSQALLMEGVRRLDEISGLRTGLPDPALPLEMPTALRTAIQAQARPEGAAVVALLDGTRGLDQILAESPLDEWATLKLLHSLRAVRALVAADVSPERRSGPRLNVEVPIEYQSLRSFQKSAMFSLSTRGVFIRTAVPFELGERLILRFSLPGREASIKVVGQVVWRNADPGKPGGVGMGIQFLDLAAADRAAIERHLAQAIAVRVSVAEDRP
jgi:uncharacterized protein (TIGR02266 family)